MHEHLNDLVDEQPPQDCERPALLPDGATGGVRGTAAPQRSVSVPEVLDDPLEPAASQDPVDPGEHAGRGERDGEQARLPLPHLLSAVKVARRWASVRCGPALSEEGQQMLELLTSEVVANAVLHGAAPLLLTVRCRPGHVTVEVDDGSPLVPVAQDVELEATGGRGVALVAMLAQAWGWEAAPPGKRVWFCLEETLPAA